MRGDEGRWQSLMTGVHLTSELDAVVIGAGSIGLWTAYKMTKRGLKVALVGPTRMPSGTFASAGNLGPTAGVTGFDSSMEGVDYAEALRTFWRLARDSLGDFVEISKNLDVELKKSGILRVYTDDSLLKDHLGSLERMKDELGLSYRLLDAAHCLDMEPLLSEKILAGVYYPDDYWVNPTKVVEGIRSRLQSMGVPVYDGVVSSFSREGSKVDGIKTSVGEFKARDYVLTTGAYARPLGETLGLDLPIYAGRGHTLVSGPLDTKLKQSVLSCAELQLGINQSSAGNLRVAGLIRIADVTSPVEPSMYDDLVEAASEYVPMVKKLQWREKLVGSLPCPPDRLPIIGRAARFENLIFGAGHCGAGMILGPISGEMIAKVASGSSDAVPELFAPRRFGL